jgi:cytochrome b561
MRQAMQIENTEERWGVVQQTLHWVVVAAVAIQLYVGFTLWELPPDDPQFAQLVPLHATSGIVIFLLMAFRLYWRRTHPIPKLPDTLTPTQKQLAQATHRTLYFLLLAMPVIGYMLINSFGKPVPFFQWELPAIIGENQGMQYSLQRLHAASGVALLLVLAVHISAALRHAWSLRDGVMERMAPFAYRSAGAASSHTAGVQQRDEPARSTHESPQ